MNSMLTVLGIMLLLIALIVPGYILKKTKLADKAAIGTLVAILLYTSQPMLTLKPFISAATTPTKELTWFMLVSFGISFLGQVLVFFIAKLILVKWKNRDNARIYTFAAIFSNCGFVGIPFIEMLTGNDYAVIFAVIYNIAFNMLIWTLGIYIVTGDRKAMKPYKAVINPAILPIFIALPMFYLPQINIFAYEPLYKLVEYLAGLSAPLSMIIVGMRMADMDFKDLFRGAGVYISSGLRLVVAPIVMLAIVYPMSLLPMFASELGRLSVAVPILALALPVAASMILFVERYNKDYKEAVKCFVTSTLLSAVTLPLVALLLVWLGLL